MKRDPLSRREALAGFGPLAGAGALLQAQQPPAARQPGGLVPRQDLVNTFEFEPMAQRKLAPELYAEIAGSDRSAFDRITFRPRMLVNTVDFDLAVDLFGSKMYAPLLAGPASHQQKYHPEGEVAMARGASAAKAVMVVSSRSSVPIGQIAAQAKAGFWYQAFPETELAAIAQAVKAGCKAVCLTIGAPGHATPGWDALDRLRKGIAVPVLLKGIMSPEEARTAVGRGYQGLVVSNHGARTVTGLAAPIEMLPPIADAVGGKAPVLIDGSFRRGSDVLKALALGAQAALVSRPLLWGLAAYGADGVQTVLEMMQTELARDMVMCGKVNVKAVDRSVVKIHKR